ncbi:MAG: polyamine aminopropyltransferase, partial [Candidatus Omnitrophica bacterium]|nr:polyamine aminopropyltransferase [Candidatus Omnitrophota bacterium]
MFEVPGWFIEKTPMNAGFALGAKIKEKLFETQSDFQKIEVYDTEQFGRMLVLDGVIQLTESDEFSYHEMFVHVPMNAHPDPKHVLVVGGGDGGMVRELVKYPQLETIEMCEIDEQVVRISEKLLPFTSSGLTDSRVTLYFEDAAEFLKRKAGAYDLILVDSSDPVGPAEVLFREPFFESIHGALKPGGAALTQCETIFLFLDIIEKMVQIGKELFPTVEYMNTLVPTYPSGMIGQLVCSKAGSYRKPV